MAAQSSLVSNSNLFHTHRLDPIGLTHITVAIGMIVSLGGVFLLLASHQILPHGMNAVSGMGTWGHVMGYGVIASGLVIMAIGAVKRCAPRTDAPSQTPSTAPLIQGAFRRHLARQELVAFKHTRDKEAATTLQKHSRGYLARKQVKAIKKQREGAILTLQSFIRMHAVQKSVEQEKRLFEGAKKYTEDSVKLNSTPNAPKGTNRRNIYMPKDLPIVIRACKDEKDSSRFPKMTQARTICTGKHVVVPKARLHGNFIIEERLPNENASTIRGMLFYYENHELYTEAVKEFTSFLCCCYLDDIVGGNKHIINYLGISQVPRFDNLLLYFTEHNQERIYKIGIVDFETFELTSHKPGRWDVYHALTTSVQLFPYHFDAIIETGKRFFDTDQKDIDGLHKKSLKSRQLYKIVCEDNLTFYQRHNITLQNPILVPLTSARREELKQHMGTFIRNMHDGGLEGYWNGQDCLNGDPDTSARRFEEELCPKMIALVEKRFKKIHAFSLKSPPMSYGELIENRMINAGITSGFQKQFEKEEEESDDSALVKTVFKGEYPPFFALFEEILNQLVKGGELSYYKARVYSSDDLIFF